VRTKPAVVCDLVPRRQRRVKGKPKQDTRNPKPPKNETPNPRTPKSENQNPVIRNSKPETRNQDTSTVMHTVLQKIHESNEYTNKRVDEARKNKSFHHDQVRPSPTNSSNPDKPLPSDREGRADA